MGPALRAEFEDKLSRLGYNVLKGPVQDAHEEAARIEGESSESDQTARVGLISHIGGHKYAGNVIIYLPPGLHSGGKPHPLAGQGIWYGRVEPKHVEGIVSETITGGKIIADMFRGGIDQDRRILRL
jgi:hypothetical protein